MSRPITNEKRNEIIRLLRREVPYIDIAREMSTSTRTIAKIAHETGLLRGYDVKKKKFNHQKRSTQLCWTCARATGFCPWSHAHRPVKGWTAEKSKVDGRETYRITACPLYVDERSER